MNRSDFPDFLLPRAQVGNETDKVSSGKPGFRCAMVIVVTVMKHRLFSNKRLRSSIHFHRDIYIYI